MTALKQNADASFGLQGSQQDDGAFLAVPHRWIPTSVDEVFYVADRPLKVKAVRARVEVAGTDAGAVTAVVKKAASGTAIASGTALHTSTINLKGTAATNQTITLSATDTDTDLAAGDAIGIDYTGTLTAAVGCITVWVCPR